MLETEQWKSSIDNPH